MKTLNIRYVHGRLCFFLNLPKLKLKSRKPEMRFNFKFIGFFLLFCVFFSCHCDLTIFDCLFTKKKKQITVKLYDITKKNY